MHFTSSNSGPTDVHGVNKAAVKVGRHVPPYPHGRWNSQQAAGPGPGGVGGLGPPLSTDGGVGRAQAAGIRGVGGVRDGRG